MSLLTLFHTMMRRAGLVERGLVKRMAQTVGAQAALASHPSRSAVTRRAVSRCNGCAQTKGCEQWLDHNESAEEAPAYCRNHDLFERLKNDIHTNMPTTA